MQLNHLIANYHFAIYTVTISLKRLRRKSTYKIGLILNSI